MSKWKEKGLFEFAENPFLFIAHKFNPKVKYINRSFKSITVYITKNNFFKLSLHYNKIKSRFIQRWIGGSTTL